MHVWLNPWGYIGFETSQWNKINVGNGRLHRIIPRSHHFFSQDFAKVSEVHPPATQVWTRLDSGKGSVFRVKDSLKVTLTLCLLQPTLSLPKAKPGWTRVRVVRPSFSHYPRPVAHRSRFGPGKGLRP